MGRKRVTGIAVVLFLVFSAGCSQEPEAVATSSAKSQAPRLEKVPVPKPEKAPACSQEVTGRLVLARDGVVIWDKPLAEVLELPGHLTMTDKKHEGRQGLPLAALLDSTESGTVILTTCSDKSTAIGVAEILQDTGVYTLTINKRGLLKLARRLDKEKHKTFLRAITRIDVIAMKQE